MNVGLASSAHWLLPHALFVSSSTRIAWADLLVGLCQVTPRTAALAGRLGERFRGPQGSRLPRTAAEPREVASSCGIKHSPPAPWSWNWLPSVLLGCVCASCGFGGGVRSCGCWHGAPGALPRWNPACRATSPATPRAPRPCSPPPPARRGAWSCLVVYFKDGNE